jgi:hypothetical protein
VSLGFKTIHARYTSRENFRANEIAELRHRDAAKRTDRCKVAQSDPLQCAEGIIRGERARQW